MKGFFDLKPVDIALNSVEIINETEELFRKCNWLALLTDVPRSRLRNMSRRRKKKMVAVYSSGIGYYEKYTGKLVHPRKKGHKDILPLPLRVNVSIVDLSSVMELPLEQLK